MHKPNYLLIFFVIVAAYIAMSFMAAAMEGPTGGVFGQKEIYGLSADFWIFMVMVPLYLLPTVLVTGLESKLLGTLAIGYVLGGTLEDFFWFVVNPYYGVSGWNPVDAPWLMWIDLELFSIPYFYITNSLIALGLYYIFFKRSERVNTFIRNIFPERS